MESEIERRVAYQPKTRLIPLAYEVYTGTGKERRVMRTMSARQADHAYERLIAEGNSAELWLGSLLLRRG